jgi:hypothetical protein
MCQGAALKCLLALRLEPQMSKNEKGKTVAELSDEKWLWDLALLCDISHYVSDLNIKLQGQKTLISGMLGL